MATWSYRVTRERLESGDYLFAVREVYYDNDGRVTGWTAKPCTAVGDTPLECADAASRMAGALVYGVLDLDTRETMRPKDAMK